MHTCSMRTFTIISILLVRKAKMIKCAPVILQHGWIRGAMSDSYEFSLRYFLTRPLSWTVSSTLFTSFYFPSYSLLSPFIDTVYWEIRPIIGTNSGTINEHNIIRHIAILISWFSEKSMLILLTCRVLQKWSTVMTLSTIQGYCCISAQCIS